MYSSQMSDTYDYEYDDEDFDDSDDKYGSRQNGPQSSKQASLRGSPSNKESESYAGSIISNQKSPTENYKSTPRDGKSPSQYENHADSRIDGHSLYSEPMADSFKTTESPRTYHESQQKQITPRSNRFSGRSMPHTSSTMHGSGGRRGRPKGQSQKQPPKGSNTNVVVKRVLSASRNKTQALQNLIMELQSQVDELRIENRDLKRAARLQEREIKRLDNEEADLPLILQKHSSETRVLREKLKRQKDLTDKISEEVRKKDLELLKLRDKMKKYEEIVKDKKLDERDKLHQKVEKLEEDVDEKQQKILDLEKSIRLNEKLRNREMKEKNDKYKKLVDEMTRLGTEFHEVQRKLREKEKELEVKNIYTQSINVKMKQVGRRNSLELLDVNSPALTRKTIRSSSPPDSLFLTDSLRGSQALSYKSDRQLTDAKKMSAGSNKYASAFEVDTLVSEQRRREADELREELRRKQDELESMEERARKREEQLRKDMESRMRRDKEDIEKKFKSEQETRENTFRAELEKLHLRKQDEGNKESSALQSRNEVDSRMEAMRKAEEENEVRRRAEAESAARRRQEEERMLAKAEKEKEEMRRQEEEQKKREEEERKRLEEERYPQQTEDEDARLKKELLLARMKAIDEGRNPDSVRVTNSSSLSGKTDRSEKKKPIFLQSDINTIDDRDQRNGVLGHSPLDFSGGRQWGDARGGSGTRQDSGSSGKSHRFKEREESRPSAYSLQGGQRIDSGKGRSIEDTFAKVSSNSPSTFRKDSSKTERQPVVGGSSPKITDRKTSQETESSRDEPLYGRRRAPPVSSDIDDPVFGSYAPTFLAKTSSAEKTSQKSSSSDLPDSKPSSAGKQARYGRRATREHKSYSPQDELFTDSVDGAPNSRVDRKSPQLIGQDAMFLFGEQNESKARRHISDFNGNTAPSSSIKSPFNGNDNRSALSKGHNDVIDDLDDVVHL